VRDRGAVESGSGEHAGDLPRLQATSLQQLGHRPWPRPRTPWIMGQSWCDLLFAHWAVDAALIAPLVPAPLRLETHGGSGWIGVTPFVLRALHVRLAPPLPPLARFCEVNVRTYVSHGGKPGILFLTLDASSAAAVAGGRLLAGLPYRHARMSVTRRHPWIDYASERAGLRVHARYAPEGPGHQPADGSLEAFLTERYCLYTARAGLLWRVDVHHRPWTLHAARRGSRAEVDARHPRVPLAGDPLLHVAAQQDVAVWAPVPAARLRGA
jgi:uncharacterized protein YqjF (DUF2071 family)